MVERGECPSRQCPLLQAMCWEEGGHSHHPCNKMSLFLYASTVLLEGGAVCCQQLQAPELVLACFLKQIILFCPRVRVCKIRSLDFWKLTSFQKSGFLGVYSKSKESKDKMGSLCPLLRLLACPSVSRFATGLRAGFLPLPGAQGLCVGLGARGKRKTGVQERQREKRVGGCVHLSKPPCARVHRPLGPWSSC